MRVLQASQVRLTPIADYSSRGAAASEIAVGSGQAHINLVAFAPGGEIGPHPAGFGQLFVVLEGSGWVAGPDAQRQTLRQGEAAFIERGEVHAKGSGGGMMALMVQITELERVAAA
jgi:quercetin dioxygenase-like cupin family protein